MQIGSLCGCSFQRCFCVELSRKRGGNRFIRETPPNSSTAFARAPLATLRPNAVARVEVIHGVKPWSQAAGRDSDVNEVRKFLRDRFRADFVTAHVCPQPCPKWPIRRAFDSLQRRRATSLAACELFAARRLPYSRADLARERWFPNNLAEDVDLVPGGTACLTVADSFLSRRKTKEKTRALQSMSERLPWMCRYECGKWVGHPTRYASKATHGLQ